MGEKRDHWILVGVSILVLTMYILSAFGIDKAVTTIGDISAKERQVTVIIDAGHGGEDGGATSCTGVLESKLNLEIALKLNDLMHLLGIRTVMIRTSDQSIYTEGSSLSAKKVSDLKQRVNIINSTENAVLISIHQNHYPDSRYKGAQVFYAQTEHSADLAQNMQRMLIKTLNKSSNRDVKKADNIYLMEKITRPGILIECGFLSNPEEEALIRDDAYQRKLCCVIAAVCSDYFNTVYSIT